MRCQIRPREGARMLLQDHFLRLLSPLRQLRKLIREFRLRRKYGRTVWCTMADVDLITFVLIINLSVSPPLEDEKGGGRSQIAYHVSTTLSPLPQHITNDCTGRFDVGYSEQAVIVLVLRIYDYEHAVFCAGLGRGHAEDAEARLSARVGRGEEERRGEEKRARHQTYVRKDFPDCAAMLYALSERDPMQWM